ncbi:MAG: lysine exporter LysO family protein [Spirochaetes bacterium]|nr:lysine exporter LysO family protein [Spirochaetota bacterium]
MTSLIQILVLAGFLAAGAVLCRLKLSPPAAVVDRLIKYILWALLFVMGFRIGNSPDLSSRLGEIGLLGAAAAVLTVAGTLGAVLAGYSLIGAFRQGGRGIPAKAVRRRVRLGLTDFRTPLFLLGVVAAGFAVGIFIAPLEGVNLNTVTEWTLDFLLFFIGMQFAQSGVSFREAFMRPEMIMVPLATAFGSLAGGLLLVPLFGLGAGKALALAGGFGWYTLSGVLITNLGDPVLGSAAFMANMLRESIALVSIPFLAATSRPYLAIGVGGATSMDVTLPLIEQCAGPESVPVSFVSGAILSLLVPILVPLFYGLAF